MIYFGYEQERVGMRCDRRAVSACEWQGVTSSRVHSMTPVIRRASNESLCRRSGRRPVVSVPEIDAVVGPVVGGQRRPYASPCEDPDAVPAHAFRCVRGDGRAVFQCHAESALREDFIDNAVRFQAFFLCRANVSRQSDDLHSKASSLLQPAQSAIAAREGASSGASSCQREASAAPSSMRCPAWAGSWPAWHAEGPCYCEADFGSCGFS